MYDSRTHSVSATPPTRTEGCTSPLKRFRQAKDSLYRAFGLIRERLSEVGAFLVDAHGEEGRGRMEPLLDKTSGIEDILARDHMKVCERESV